MPPTATVGFPIIFFVKNWIVIDPVTQGEFGRIPLPPPTEGPLRIWVARKGDRIILSSTGIRYLLLSASGNFKRLRVLDRSAVHSSTLVPVTSSSHGQALYVNHAAFVQRHPSYASSFFSLWSEETALDLGFTPDEFHAAILSWSKLSTSSLDRGLAALYFGRTQDATFNFTRAASDAQEPIAALRSAAFAYALEQDYARSELLLNQVIERSGRLDPQSFRNLGYVFTLDGKSIQAQEQFDKASQLDRQNLLIPTISLPENKLRPTYYLNPDEAMAALIQIRQTVEKAIQESPNRAAAPLDLLRPAYTRSEAQFNAWIDILAAAVANGNVKDLRKSVEYTGISNQAESAMTEILRLVEPTKSYPRDLKNLGVIIWSHRKDHTANDRAVFADYLRSKARWSPWNEIVPGTQ